MGWLLVWLLQLTGCAAFERPDLANYAAYAWPQQAPAAGPKLEVTFLGTTSLYFNDGRTRILLDGFFTRPEDLMQVFFGEIATDEAKVKRYLHRLGVHHLAAMPVFHSHYDHAMDTATIARLTGARVLGSRSTVMIGRGAGLPERQLTEVRVGKPYVFGRFRITFFKSKHVPLPSVIEATGMMGEIEAPLRQPASIYAYAEGLTYAILIEHPLGNSLLHSGAFLPSEQIPKRVDNLFLCTPGLQQLSSADQEAFYQKIIHAPGVRRVIPVHWDDFSRSLDLPLLPLPRFAEDLDASMQFLIAQSQRVPGFQLRFLQGWQTVNLALPPRKKSTLIDKLIAL